MLMRPALAPKVIKAEQDEVEGGAPGKRDSGIIDS